MARRWPSGGLELFGSAANCDPLAGYYLTAIAALSSFRRKAISSRACLAWDSRYRIPKRFLQHIQRCGSEDAIAASEWRGDGTRREGPRGASALGAEVGT